MANAAILGLVCIVGAFSVFTSLKLIPSNNHAGCVGQAAQGVVQEHTWNASMIDKRLSAAAADLVIADPTITSSADLASALFWIRKKNDVLHKRLNLKIAELANVQVNTLDASHSSYMKEVLYDACTFRRILAANDARFEMDETDNTKQSIRLDGIPQTNIYDKFVFEYCVYDNNPLAGVFRISKMRQCKEDAHFSDDKDYSTYIRQHIGPDDFVLTLEGYELHDMVSDARYLGSCTYDIPFEVNSPGQYILNLLWWRENFASAVDIAASGWQAGHLDLPLGTSTVMTLTGKANEQHKENCDLRDMAYSYMPGRWQLIRPSPDNEEVSASRIQNDIVSGKYRWHSKACTLKYFSSTDAAQCLSGKRVTFHGDSHMRQLRNSLALLACGVSLGVQVMGCVTQCPGLQHICSKADGLAVDPSFMLNEEDDLTVANFGHHWIDGERRRTVASYKQHIDTVVASIKARNSSLLMQKLVWYESNAMQLRKDAWIQGYDDQRTNVKIRAMNKYANAQMKTLGIPIIPSFTQTMPILVHNEDMAHFDLNLLYASAAQFVLGLLCPDYLF